MARIINYKELFVWQKSVDLAKQVYNLFPQIKNDKLVELLARSSVSIASNIAEGNSRQISKEYRQFLYCALGEISQVDCQLVLAKELGFITQEEYEPLEERVVELRKMLYGLISKLKQRVSRHPGSSYSSNRDNREHHHHSSRESHDRSDSDDDDSDDSESSSESEDATTTANV